MKKFKIDFIKNVLFSAIICATLGACDVTDLEPSNAISEELAFTSQENIELAMVGVYDAAQSGFYLGSEVNDRGYVFGAAHIQQGDIRGEDLVNVNVFYGFTYEGTYTASTANNQEYWANAYRVINLANLFIEGVQRAVENEVLTQEEANAYEGEARMLRAMSYFELVVHYARPYRDNNGANLGVPIRKEGINSAAAVEEAITVGRNTVAEVYDFILEDLNFAEGGLPATRTHQVTRATSGAAIAYKTRIYLHMGEWPAVITEGNKLVPPTAPYKSPIGGYELTPSVDGPFVNNLSTESILSMEMNDNDNLNVNSALANMLGSPSEGARGEVAISPIIWNQDFWHPDDLRRSNLLVVNNPGTGRYHTAKYRDYTGMTDYSPIIRYAEVLLNLAEAEARVNGVSERALSLLNAVRDRAKAGSMESYTLGNFGSGDDLVQAILNERRIELLAEGLRYKDIARTIADPQFSTGGIPAKMRSSEVNADAYNIGTPPTALNISAIPYDNFKFIWPIPANELVNNPTLAKQQNPQY